MSKEENKDFSEEGLAAEYMIRVVGVEPPNLDPSFEEKHIDDNPFGFVRKSSYWRWIHPDGRAFELSPEPPGLQVIFYRTSAEEEKKILDYIQSGIKEETTIHLTHLERQQ